MPAQSRNLSFTGRPRALRRRIIGLLDRFEGLTAQEIARFAYARRIRLDRVIVCSASQASATRRALQHLAQRGHVAHIGWQHRCKLWGRAYG